MDFASLLNLLTVPAEMIVESTVPGITPLNLLILSSVLFVASGYYLISKYLERKKKIKELDDEIQWELEQLAWQHEEKPTTFLELPPPEVKLEEIMVKSVAKPAKKKIAKKKAVAKKKTVKKSKPASAD